MNESALGTLGRYRLVRRIGRGDVTEAFEARAEGAAGVTKTVCVKRILPAYARRRDFVRVFARQTKIAMAIAHGNIAQTLDLGREGKEIFLATEYVGGESLDRLNRRLAKRNARVPAWIAVHIVMEICRALEYAHGCVVEGASGQGAVHGDVSPRSIILSREGQVKLVDFGMGRVYRAVEHHGAVLARLAYTPPRLREGEDAGAWGDVYGAGAVLYDLLAGRPPHDSASIVASLGTKDPSPPPLSEVAPWVDSDLCEIVDLALALDPRDRLSGAGALEEMLASYLHTRREMVSEEDIALLVSEVFDTEDPVSASESGIGSSIISSTELTGGITSRRPGRGAMAAAAVGALAVIGAGVALGIWLGSTPPEARVVEVRSQPPGARILVDGAETGVSTDGRLRDVAIDRVLEVTAVLPGYRPQTLHLAPGAEALMFHLRREPRTPRPTPEVDARPDPPLSLGPPVRVRNENGVRIVTMRRRAISLIDRDLPAVALDLDRSAVHTLELTSSMSVAMIRPASRLAWLAKSPDGRIVSSGSADSTGPVRIPRGAARLYVFRLQWGSCEYNNGEARLVIKRAGRVMHRQVLEASRDCMGISGSINTAVRDVGDEEGIRVEYEGPADGPRLFVASSSNNPMNLSRPADESNGSLLPGESMTAYHLVSLHFATFEDVQEEEPEPLQVRLVPVGSPEEASPAERRR